GRCGRRGRGFFLGHGSIGTSFPFGAKPPPIAYHKVLFLLSHTSSIPQTLAALQMAVVGQIAPLRGIRRQDAIIRPAPLPERQFPALRPASPQLDSRPCICRLATNVAQPNVPVTRAQRNGGDAGDLGHCPPLRLMLAQCLGTILKLEPHESSMHLAARTNAFHDLLANVASLGEVQSLGLTGLLWEVAITYVLPVLRNPVQDPPPLQRLYADVRRAWEATAEQAALAFVFGHGHPYFVPARLVLRATYDHNGQAVDREFANLQRLHTPYIYAGCGQRFLRLGATESRGEDRSFSHLHFVHDDVAFHGGE